MIPRYYANIETYIQQGKVLVIYGARRVGKTTLLREYLNKTQSKYRLDSGDNIRIQQVLSSGDFKQIGEYVQGYELIAIDEAQNIPEIGKGLKIIVDEFPEKSVIATGSSSFDLSNRIGEPLTGRKRTLTLYPIAQMELARQYSPFDLKEQLEEYLIYGSYPEVVTAETKSLKSEILDELVHSYLYKDILTLERVKGAKVISDLVKLLAFQVGSEVSLHELSENLGIDVKTVQRYIDLLEKSFVIFSLSGFSRNLRKEIKTKNKYYFYDNGVRNAVISQFNALDLRNDTGQLWENFILIERMKKRSYEKIYGNSYFWRTYDKQEIDLVEERDGKFFGFECKWNVKKKIAVPKDWRNEYQESEFEVVNRENYLDFIL